LPQPLGDILWTIPRGLWIPGSSEEFIIADKRPVTPANRARRRASKDLYIADLFAGAGGITEGFRRAGFTPVAAVEFDKWAARTYAANFGDHVLACPIEEVAVRRTGHVLVWSGLDVEGKPTQFESPEIDVLVGGPPCQGFSPLGRMNDWDFNDPRNKLWKHYVRILDVLQPKVFILENVPELLKSSEFQRLRSHVAKTYDLDFNVLNAVHYGVPQARRRAIVIGSRVCKAALPVATTVRRTVRDAIGDLPATPTGKDWHLARNPTTVSIERYKTVPPGGNRFDLMRRRPDITPDCWMKKKTGSTDVFGRMIWDEAAPTIRTEFFKPEKGRYLHPEAHRPITIREAARLQTFPDGFVFVGSNVQVAKQIGNAVPVDLAERIAIRVRSMLAPDGTALGIAGGGRNEARTGTG
jgi:DNA (cytosine-5)-methyltransferase 1